MNNMNDKNEVILPVTYPLTTSYSADAILFTILNSYKETESWIYNNFVNLWADTRNGYTPFRFSSFNVDEICPFIISKQVLRNDIYNKYENVVDFLVSSLSLGYYIHLNYDEYYIPHTKNYQMEHFKHELFIFGFKKDTRQFHIADFFDGRKYSFEIASFNDVEASINSDIIINTKSFIKLLKYNDCNYKFNINLIIKNVSDYLNYTYTILDYEKALIEPFDMYSIRSGYIVFGMAYYDCVINIIHKMIEDNLQYKDIRVFHTLYNHKVIMTNRFIFLKINGFIKNSSCLYERFKEIENHCLNTRNLFIKYLVTSNTNLLKDIIDNINYVKVEETMVLNDLLSEIMVKN